MKLLSFSLDGRASWGMVAGRDVRDLGLASEGRAPTLAAALRLYTPDQIASLADAARVVGDIEQVTYLPVIDAPTKIFCVGLNYEEHRVEANRPKTGHPTIFARFSASQVGHKQPLVVPAESASFDYEGEIAVIIGRAGRRIPEERAWEHIGGYAPYNDGSVRDWQNHASQWTPGKNFTATGGFGPWMATRGEIADGQVLELTTRLNGTVMQQAKTDQLIFPIPRLISYISTFTMLEPGDVIVTGTPGGVGFKRTPPVYMRPGDVVEIEVGGIGTLVNGVVAEQA
ncbi:MAG TPA: fumarylacetoacetate hydrolase family protein [Noviherbaspirillum sp.]|jgi:2-keto-4-pentenoate hydratase/2-oxohepta-3-ene-1,7-dioic acid hydratase in catechol pathway|uniref:fumarylacetoacetate hydrolase family protein n=1 Tax=Noviherbaspirillum sp. TaxID=1926288 RepID=UPI002F9540AB